jgi:hypothetical protein
VDAGPGRDHAHGGRGDDFLEVLDLVDGNDYVSGGKGHDGCSIDAYKGADVVADDCEGVISAIACPPTCDRPALRRESASGRGRRSELS